MTANRERLQAVLDRNRASDWLRKMPPAWLLISAAGLLTTMVLVWYFTASSTKTLQYVTKPVSRGDVIVTVRATGTIQPTDKVEISSELSGTMREVLVDFNHTVKRGQVLARLDTEALDAQLASARASLAARRARVREVDATVSESRAALGRAQSLFARQFLSQQGLEQARAAYERAVASLGSAQADMAVTAGELKVRQTNMSKATIRSPIDGIVLARNVEPGQTVASSLQAPVLFTLAQDLKRMQLEVDIDEADVSLVRADNKATFWVEGLAARVFPASITVIHYSPETVAGVVTYKTILTIDNSELLLRPGMTATADIKVQEVLDTLLLPNAALRFSPKSATGTPQQSWLQRLMPRAPGRRTAQRTKAPGDGKSVWVLVGEAAEERQVETGASDGNNTSITSGDLKVGDLVIVDSNASD
jgi:HlyD family secretion protein